MKVYLLLIATLLVLGGCSVTGPMKAGTGTGPTQVLLTQAQEQEQLGELHRAIALVERAVRIEPRNPYVWHQLARLQLAAGNKAKAGQFARRSDQFAGGDQQLRRANRRIIETTARDGL